MLLLKLLLLLLIAAAAPVRTVRIPNTECSNSNKHVSTGAVQAEPNALLREADCTCWWALLPFKHVTFCHETHLKRVCIVSED